MPNKSTSIKHSLVWLLTNVPMFIHIFVKGILAVNILVFCLWRIRPLHRFMMQYFRSSAHKKGKEVVISFYMRNKNITVVFRLQCVDAVGLFQSRGVLAYRHEHASIVELYAHP